MILTAAILVASLETRTVRLADVLPSAPVAIRSVVIARLPASARAMTLPRPALAALIRRRAPGAALAGVDDVRLVLNARQAQRLPYQPVVPAIERGAHLAVTAAAGPVRVTRAVTALQSGRAGGALFVRDEDGQVYAARIAEAAR